MSNLLSWRLARDCLQRGERCVLLITAEIKGSGPGSPGSVMVVSENASSGTIGGGAMEQDLMKRSRRKLQTQELNPELAKHFHLSSDKMQDESEGASVSGMLCSGEQTTIIVPLDSSSMRTVNGIVGLLESERPGRLRISKSGIGIDEDSESAEHEFRKIDHDWSYSGPVGSMDTVYIIGGGHVGRALAELLPGLSFTPVIIDSREQSDWGDATTGCRWIQSPFHEAHLKIRDGDHSWAVIMTPEHESDGMVLGTLAKMNLRYVGMMASMAKRGSIFSHLEEQGVSRDFLESVHCPIGLSIGSRTPAEIAVSIAAELIKLR